VLARDVAAHETDRASGDVDLGRLHGAIVPLYAPGAVPFVAELHGTNA
jgi:hypothetical protein